MRAVLRFMTAGTFAAGILLVSPAAAHAVDQYNCEDFHSQAEAQAVLNADPSDPNNLDGDNDGVACQTYDYGSTGSTNSGGSSSPTPSGGVDTGFGGMADNSSSTGLSSAQLIVGGAALVGSSALVVRRRRSRRL